MKTALSFSHFSLILVLLILTGCRDTISTQIPTAKEGVLNLSNWDFKQNGPIELIGDWAFFSKALLEPNDFKASEPKPTGYVSIRSDLQTTDQTPSIADYATYRMRIFLPGKPGVIAIGLFSMQAAYKLWIADQPSSQYGVIGKTKESNKFWRDTQILVFPNQSNYVDLTFQISNFHQRNESFWKTIQIGTVEQMESIRNRKMVFEIFLLGAIFIMALYHFAFYALRRNDRSAFFLGLLCFFVSLKPLFLYGRQLFSFFAGLDLTIQIQIEYITYYLIVVFFVRHTYHLFPDEIHKQAVWLNELFAFVFLVLTLLLPISTFLQTVVLYDLFIAAGFVYWMIMLIRTVMHRKEGSLIYFAATIILSVLYLNDLLLINRLIHSIRLSNVGFFIFILFQSFILSRRFTKSFKIVEVMTTQLQVQNAELNKLDKMKDRFMANTSHELRTPLSGIIGLADALLKGVAGTLNQKVTDNLAMIVSSAKRLSGLVNDILDLSRLENSDLTLNIKTVDVHSLVDVVLAAFQPIVKHKELQITNDTEAGNAYVCADENRLQQIFYNLIGNAVKFTERGKISITSTVKNNIIEIAVSDTGSGIPQDKFDLIFKSFERHEVPGIGTSEGTGLGLSITRQLLALHNGRIWLESIPGKGSTFFFTLPSASKPVGKAEVPLILEKTETDLKPVVYVPRQTHNATGSGELLKNEGHFQVLVVDDESVNLQVISDYLALEGISHNTATNGKEALNQIEQGQVPDIVLLDIMMPEMSGYEVCRKLRRDFSPSQLPIVMITAKNRISDLVEGFESGANDYLTKPCSKEELTTRIRAQLGMKQAFETLQENQTLRQEIKQRIQTEQLLRMTRQRLSDMLDKIGDALLAVNENHEISFYNRPFRDMTGYAEDSLLGKPYTLLFDMENSQQIKNVIKNAMISHFSADNDREFHGFALKAFNQKMIEVDLIISPLELEDEQQSIIIIRKQPILGSGTIFKRSQSTGLKIIKELNVHSERIRNLETTLERLNVESMHKQDELASQLSTVETVMESLEHSSDHDATTSVTKLVVDLMNVAVDYWIESTGSTKLDLAKNSGKWKIYADHNGWERTRTLDKYLSTETCPVKPRLESVVGTAFFVLGNCQVQSPLRQQLEAGLDKLRQAIK